LIKIKVQKKQHKILFKTELFFERVPFMNNNFDQQQL